MVFCLSVRPSICPSRPLTLDLQNYRTIFFEASLGLDEFEIDDI